MRRIVAALLAMMLLAAMPMAGFALAESVDGVNSYVARKGFKPIAAKNRSRISGCWFIEDDDGETLQWSDASSTYTVTARSGKGLRQLYGELIGMNTWDTCTYTIDGKVQFAYNAPEIKAVRSYKTLNNYVKYVSAYIDSAGHTSDAKPASERQTYIINKNTKKFHRQDCITIRTMKNSNREKYIGKRDDLIQKGYEPCKHCDP